MSAPHALSARICCSSRAGSKRPSGLKLPMVKDIRSSFVIRTVKEKTPSRWSSFDAGLSAPMAANQAAQGRSLGSSAKPQPHLE